MSRGYISEYWNRVGEDLKTHYEGKYVTQHRFKKPNFLEALVPYHDTFFGTKVHTILILNNPRDSDEDEDNDQWDIKWPEDEINESIEKIKQSYHVWPYYKVDVYVSFICALDSSRPGVHEGDPDSDLDDDNGPLVNRMEDLEDKVKDVCDQLKDFGFEYKGRINEEVEANFFFETIDGFYGKVVGDV